MFISATVGADEWDFEITPPEENKSIWIGKRIGGESLLETEYISFEVDNGIIVNLKVHEVITTDIGIVLERLIEAVKFYNESRQMGFEVENTKPIDNLLELNPYDPEQIKVRPLVLSAYQVFTDTKKGRIDLNPNFQRNFVWDDFQKSKLIESMLLKIPLPAFYFAEDKTGKFQVIDGLQRLTVINQFLNNEFKLRNLEYLKQLEGFYYSEDKEKGITSKNSLFDPYASRVETTQLSINVIESSSPLRVKYDIFYRINTGGRPLNRQEIRNCFASDRSRKLLRRMVQQDIFDQATGSSINDTRMDGQEMALRYLGFLLYRKIYTGEMNSFLDNVLEKLNDLNSDELQNCEVKFYKSLRCAYHLFGSYAFRKCLPTHLKPGVRKQFLNKAMFIVWTALLSNVDESKVNLKGKGEFQLLLSERLEGNVALFDALTTGTTDRGNLEFVFEEFQELLASYLNDK